MALYPFHPFEQSQVPCGTSLSAKLTEAATQMHRLAANAMSEAVAQWSAQCGMNPERWLEYFMPVPEIGDTIDGKLTITIRAKLREDFVATTTIAIE